MIGQTIDVRELLVAIHTQKEVDADLCLDFGCKLETDDPKPLIKVINYILNYLKPLTDAQLQVGLNLQSENFRISFLALSESDTVPPFSDKLAEAMEIYNATVEFVHEAGKYIQIVLVFQQKISN